MPEAVYLIPTWLGPENQSAQRVVDLPEILRHISHFAVENEKSARRFLKNIDPSVVIDDLKFYSIGKHNADDNQQILLESVFKGHRLGILSEAGMPAIADPGARLVLEAHQMGVSVKPLSGAGSIPLALMAGGLGGQQFTFHGYVPADKNLRSGFWKEVLSSARRGYTQLFMETPYRNVTLFQECLKHLPGDLYLCISANLTQPTEYIATRQIGEWKTMKEPKIHKVPAIFSVGTAK